MDDPASSLRLYIINKIAGDLSFSKDERRFRLTLRNVTPHMRNEILLEGSRYGFPESYTESVLNSVTSNLEISLAAATRNVQLLEPSTLKGEKVTLVCSDQTIGIERVSLLSIGAGRFFVLGSDRQSLHPEDIVAPLDSRPWAPGFPVYLKVYRRGVRYPSPELAFRTYTVREIKVETPSEALKVADSRDSHSATESETGRLGKSSLCLGRNPMTLLINLPGLPLVADFDNSGNAAFRTNPDVVQPVCKGRREALETGSIEANSPVYFTTGSDGTLILTADGEIKVTKKAKGNTTIAT